MSEPMTIEKCRELQGTCSAGVYHKIDELREIIRVMDLERSGNRVRFETMIADVTEIKTNVAIIRKEADALYAIKLIEKIVFGIVSLICIAVITALIKLVVMP